MGWPVINFKLELGPLSIKEWDTGGKNVKIGPYLAELVFWLSCKISFFTIYNHTNGLLVRPLSMRVVKEGLWIPQ